MNTMIKKFLFKTVDGTWKIKREKKKDEGDDI